MGTCGLSGGHLVILLGGCAARVFMQMEAVQSGRQITELRLQHQTILRVRRLDGSDFLSDTVHADEIDGDGKFSS